VQVEGTYGNVERIGLRSTRILTDENIHVIVPNSAFLENNVVNWTHTDPEVQIKIAVGVAYGSPTREVEKQLLRAVSEHPQVLPEPPPVVRSVRRPGATYASRPRIGLISAALASRRNSTAP